MSGNCRRQLHPVIAELLQCSNDVCTLRSVCNNGITGLFYGGGFKQLGIQLLGVVSVILWVTITMVIVFNLLKHTIGLRASVEEETKGLDVTEHNLASSYADFMPVVFTGREDAPAVSAAPVSVEKYGCPVPPAKKITLPDSIAATAASFENREVNAPHTNGVNTSVFIPT